MVHELFDILSKRGYHFFTGVPDSALKPFQNDILSSGLTHIPAVNEAHAVAIAFGAELAGKKSCVYLQNSGLGNVINPLTSLCLPFDVHPLLIIGHRHTLPQHKVMGETDRHILETIKYKNYILVEGENNAK
jgi:phosphonopyruvate decarboxylase